MSIRKSIDFTIEINDKKLIAVNKWYIEDAFETDEGWDIIAGNKYYNSLDDDKQCEIDDFINDISLFN
ncbi:hypothetical protein [Desulfonauticus submarinus]